VTSDGHGQNPGGRKRAQTADARPGNSHRLVYRSFLYLKYMFNRPHSKPVKLQNYTVSDITS